MKQSGRCEDPVRDRYFKYCYGNPEQSKDKQTSFVNLGYINEKLIDS